MPPLAGKQREKGEGDRAEDTVPGGQNSNQLRASGVRTKGKGAWEQGSQNRVTWTISPDTCLSTGGPWS